MEDHQHHCGPERSDPFGEIVCHEWANHQPEWERESRRDRLSCSLSQCREEGERTVTRTFGEPGQCVSNAPYQRYQDGAQHHQRHHPVPKTEPAVLSKACPDERSTETMKRECSEQHPDRDDAEPGRHAKTLPREDQGPEQCIEENEQ